MKWTVFDFEFNQLLPEIGTILSDDIHIICGAIYSSGDQYPSVWHENVGQYMSEYTLTEFVKTLVKYFKEGHLIATWGGSASDFKLLAKECPSQKDAIRMLALNSIDVPMCACVSMGTMMGLNAACMALGLQLKQADDSKSVPALWASGDRQKVLQHVSDDAYATFLVITKAEETQELLWISQKNQLKRWHVDFISVKECLRKELPAVPWTIGPSQNAKLLARWLLFY